MRAVRLVALLVVTLAVAHAEPPRPREGVELKRLRVLLVLDTDSNLRESLKIDWGRVAGLFAASVPKGRYTLDVLTGPKATRANVLKYYRDLKTGPDEGLLFFFGGHGAIDSKRGHLLQMQPSPGPVLLRSDLRKAMEAKKAGLTVLLTDCCSTLIKLPKEPLAPQSAMNEEPKIALHPTLRELFFLARGTVDITGTSPGAASWGDDKGGGIFTRVCALALTDPIADLDLNRDGRVTWEEAFAHLRVRTAAEFKRWKAGLPRGEQDRLRDAKQRPYAFLLREAGRPPVPGSALRK